MEQCGGAATETTEWTRQDSSTAHTYAWRSLLVGRLRGATCGTAEGTLATHPVYPLSCCVYARDSIAFSCALLTARTCASLTLRTCAAGIVILVAKPLRNPLNFLLRYPLCCAPTLPITLPTTLPSTLPTSLPTTLLAIALCFGTTISHYANPLRYPLRYAATCVQSVFCLADAVRVLLQCACVQSVLRLPVAACVHVLLLCA